MRAAQLLPLLLLASAATRPPLSARHGMVASPNPQCSAAGVDAMRRGGNAVDAAVAVTFCVGVTEPQSAGIGGGGFALWMEGHSHLVRALDFRERAPLGATRDMYLDAHGHPKPGASTLGHQSVAVPGTVAGLWELHQLGGRLPWASLLTAAIHLAEDGVVVMPRLHEALQGELPHLRRFPETARTFLKKDAPYDVGDLLMQKDLAETLRTIQSGGAQGFYGGEIARAISADMEENGGLITPEDLAAYAPVWRLPLQGTYEGHTVLSFPPPSSGGVHLLQMLHFLESQHLGRSGVHSAATLHAMTEAMRRAYADRSQHLGDPAFLEIPLQGLLSPHYLAARWSTFSPRLAQRSAVLGPGDPWPFEGKPSRAPPPMSLTPDAGALKEDGHTSHLSVVDSEGGAVSLTFTVNTFLGSAVVVPGTGVLLNNEMDDFSIAPGVPNAYGLLGGQANAIAPGKIPLSSMTPTLLLTGAQPLAVEGPPPGHKAPALRSRPDQPLRLVLGAPGGSTIITTVLQIILNVLDHHMDVEQAVASPRVHHQWMPDSLRVEEGTLPRDVMRGLFARGHTLRSTPPWGNAQAVEFADGVWRGASDPRGEGLPAGY